MMINDTSTSIVDLRNKCQQLSFRAAGRQNQGLEFPPHHQSEQETTTYQQSSSRHSDLNLSSELPTLRFTTQIQLNSDLRLWDNGLSRQSCCRLLVFLLLLLPYHTTYWCCAQSSPQIHNPDYTIQIGVLLKSKGRDEVSEDVMVRLNIQFIMFYVLDVERITTN